MLVFQSMKLGLLDSSFHVFNDGMSFVSSLAPGYIGDVDL